jgi:hypothetical protein
MKFQENFCIEQQHRPQCIRFHCTTPFDTSIIVHPVLNLTYLTDQLSACCDTSHYLKTTNAFLTSCRYQSVATSCRVPQCSSLMFVFQSRQITPCRSIPSIPCLSVSTRHNHNTFQAVPFSTGAVSSKMCSKKTLMISSVFSSSPTRMSCTTLIVHLVWSAP